MTHEELIKDILNNEQKELLRPKSKIVDTLPLKMYHVNHEELVDNFNGF